MTIHEAKVYIRFELSGFYSKNEIFGLSKIIFSDVFNISSINMLMKEKDTLPQKDIEILKKIVSRLKNNEPIQYIIEKTEFYGLKFNVNKHVLIPRQETEELVDLIILENIAKQNLKILDIGTGSGCIAISLSKNIKTSQVSALDISKDALKIAKTNSFENNTHISFIQEDILSKNIFINNKFDIIVSNPPYVTNSEKDLIEQNVLAFEPELALFVKDNKPLIFYEQITNFASKNLNKNGKLYFEINENFGNDVQLLLQKYNFKNIRILKDINEKARIVLGNL